MANTGAAASVLAAAYEVPVASIGLLVTSLFAVQLVAQVGAGQLVDRLGARRMGWVCVATFVTANAVACVAPHFGLGLACRAVMGPAMALSFIGGSAYIRSAGGSSFSQGVFGGVSVGASGLALAAIPLLTPLWGWRAPFAGAAGMALLAVPFLALGPPVRRLPRAPIGGQLRSIAADPVIWRLGVIQAVAFGLSAVTANWITLLLERVSGATAQAAGAAGALTLAVGILSRPLGGHLAARYPQRAPFFIGAALALGAGATMVLVVGPPMPVVVLACAALGFAAGMPFGPVMDRAGRAYGGSPAAAIAVLNTGAMLVIVLGTPALGATFDLPGDGRLGFAAVACLWAASVAAASVLAPPTGPAPPGVGGTDARTVPTSR